MVWVAVVQGAILLVTVIVVLSVRWKGLSIVERDAAETGVEISIWVISGVDWLVRVEGGAEGGRRAERTGGAEEGAGAVGEVEGTGGVGGAGRTEEVVVHGAEGVRGV